MKNIYTIALLFAGVTTAFAQEETKSRPAFAIDGYAEVYYNYSVNQPKNNQLPGYLYSFNRHNEISLNFGMIRATYEKDRVRGQLALMAGSYVKSNLAAEPEGLKNIYEATVGLKLSETKDWWLDAGIFSSHIGYESAVGADVWTLTRSIAAENSPYFSAGVKVSYKSPNQKWFLSGLVLNGWQRMQRVDGNQTLAFGHQVTYQPTENVRINSSSFIGSDTPDSLRQRRYFHDLYAEIKINPQLRVIAGFDVGAQQQYKHSKSYNLWYSPTLVGKYSINDQWSISVRGEYYADKKQVIIVTDTENGFQTWGYSVNLDYVVTKGVLWRMEIRNFNSKDPIFTRDDLAVQSNALVSSSLSIKF